MLRYPTAWVHFKNFKKTVIYPGVVLKNGSGMVITNSVIARGCSIKSFAPKAITITNSYIGDRAYLSSNGGLRISNASLAPNVFISTYRHGLIEGESDSHSTISIESPKLVGQNVSIIGNVRIGEGAVVGACSVVTKDAEPYSMYAGNPARLIKRYSKEKNAWISVKE